jgi:hypothetical protein
MLAWRDETVYSIKSVLSVGVLWFYIFLTLEFHWYIIICSKLLQCKCPLIMPDFLIASGVLKLGSSWSWKILKTSSAAMKGFQKAVISTWTHFWKFLQTVFKNPQELSSSAAFGFLFIWRLEAFGNPFMTALVSFGEIGRISKRFLRSRSTRFKQF